MKRSCARSASVFFYAALAVAWLTSSVQAAPPVLDQIEPRGARRGDSVQITLRGRNLAGAQLLSQLPGVVETVGSQADSLTLKVQFPPTAAVGLYPIRVHSDKGLSGAVLFSLGDLPEVAEHEPNDETNAAMALSLPMTVNGTIAPTDRDFFQFTAKQGERVTVEVESARLGSNLDPLVRVLDGNGLELAYNDDSRGLGKDSRLNVVVPKDGTYFAVIHDAQYAGAAPNFYRLKIGSFNYAEGIFPLGWQRGQPTQVSLVGGTLPDPWTGTVNTAVPDWLDWQSVALAAAGPQASLPMKLILSDRPETLEPAADAARALAPDTVVNGRISQPGEVDRYSFKVAPGQKWQFDVSAASLGSPLDPVLNVLDLNNNQLAGADDTGKLDPQLTFDVPQGASEVAVTVQDLLSRGGPAFAYRLQARSARSEFGLEVATPVVNIPREGTALVRVRVERDGYNGPVQLGIGDGLSDIVAEGGLVPEGAQEGILVLSARPGAATRVFDLPVRGWSGPVTQPSQRSAQGSHSGGVALAQPPMLNVPAAVTERLPVRLKAEAQQLALVHGHTVNLKITAERDATATEAISLKAAELPKEVGGGEVAIAKESNEAALPFTVNTNAPLGPATLLLEAKTQVGGQEETITLPPLQVQVVRPFSLEILSSPVMISVGSKTVVEGVVRRVGPFRGAVRIEAAEAQPDSVWCSTATVAEGESVFRLELVATQSAKPADFNLALRGTTQLGNPQQPEAYAIPPVAVPVRVVAAGQ